MSKVYEIRKGKGFEQAKRTAIYIRISTAKNGQSKSIDSQVSPLLEYVQRAYFTTLAGIYTDVGSGRKAGSRKELRRLLDDCDKGIIDQIVVKAISRFGRNTVDTLQICRKLAAKEINVHFHNENIDSMSKDGELTLTLTSAVAEGESFEKSQNIKWGIAKRAQDPNAAIYSRECYGYRKDETGSLVIEESEAKMVQHIYESYLGGDSIMKIIKWLEENKIPSPTGRPVWSKRTIEKMLQNEKYYGDVILYKSYTDEYPSAKILINNGEKEQLRVEEHHTGIISKELFDQVQDAIESRKRKK